MTTAKEGIEILNDLGTKGYEAAKALSEINLRVMERTAAKHLDTMSLLMDGSLRNIKMITEAKNTTDLVRSQVELARELGERMLTAGRETVKLALDSRDEYRSWLEQGIQTVGDKFSKMRPAA